MYITTSKLLNMKFNNVFLFVCLALLSCNYTKPKPLQVYNLKIKQRTLNFDGSAMVDNIKEDTVMAVDDTIAYDRALRTYFATKHTEHRLNYRVSRSESFKLLDSLGRDVMYKLNQEVTDSLKTRYYALRPEFKKYL